MKYPKTKEILNQAVADTTQLMMVVRQQHWYMRGPEFLKLHPYLDKVMDELDEQRDLISERLITIDGSPYSSLQEVLDHTKIEAHPGEWGISTRERFATIIADYRYLEHLYEEGIKVSDEEGDYGSNDILTSCHTDIEKRIWMMQAQIGKAPKIDE